MKGLISLQKIPDILFITFGNLKERFSTIVFETFIDAQKYEILRCRLKYRETIKIKAENSARNLIIRILPCWWSKDFSNQFVTPSVFVKQSE